MCPKSAKSRNGGTNGHQEVLKADRASRLWGGYIAISPGPDPINEALKVV
jgi:hypothetical protein